MQVEPEICDSALRSSQQTSNQGSENDGLSPRTFGADAHQLVQVGPRSYEFLITGKPLESPDCPLPRIGMGPWMEHLVLSAAFIRAYSGEPTLASPLTGGLPCPRTRRARSCTRCPPRRRGAPHSHTSMLGA